MAEEFTGFANTVDPKSGKIVDAREVPAYEDKSEAGKIRTASQTTESSIVKFRTSDNSTNGSPMAVVGGRAPEQEPDEVDEVDAPDGEEAGGEEDADKS